MTEAKKTHAASADDGTMSCCDSVVHLGGRSINLDHVVQYLWEPDGSVTLNIRGLKDLKLEGADRDLLAEALGLCSADEMKLNQKGVKDRLALAQAARLDAAKTKSEEAAKTKEAKAKADAHEAEVAAKAEAKESHKGHK